jgi:hypothetical protein
MPQEHNADTKAREIDGRTHLRYVASEAGHLNIVD